MSNPSITDELQDAVLDSSDVEEFLTELTRLSVRALSSPGEDVLCGITLLRPKRVGTVASSSERARKMDEIQYTFPDGPCLSASRNQATIYVPDLVEEQRWPEYSKVVLEHGMRSILAVPFLLDSQARAALNLYADEPVAFSADAIEAVESYAQEASRALRLAVRIADHSETSRHLKAAMDSRTAIDTAIGIIMGQNRCSQEAAFKILQSASSTRNIKLRDVATAVIHSLGQGASTHFDY
jgi:GAF domain-containing protein